MAPYIVAFAFGALTAWAFTRDQYETEIKRMDAESDEERHQRLRRKHLVDHGL